MRRTKTVHKQNLGYFIVMHVYFTLDNSEIQLLSRPISAQKENPTLFAFLP